MAIYSLKQRIFIVKHYYQNGNSTEKVKNEFKIEYNDKPTDENIVELVELFENFGSVLINNDTQIKIEMNVDSIKLEGDPEEFSYNRFEIKPEQSDTVLSRDQPFVDPLTYSESGSEGNLPTFFVSCDNDNPETDVSIGVRTNCISCDIDECSGMKGDGKEEKNVISEETNDKCYPCSRCDEKFETKLAHLQHMTEQHAKQCDICNKKFLNLDAHMAFHTKERCIKCTKCSLKFFRQKDLRIHSAVHTDETPYACAFPGCSKSFKTQDRLSSHKRTHVSDAERPYKCEICRKGFLKNSALKLHFTTHTGEKNFICNVCGATRRSKHHLMNHMRTHTGDKIKNNDLRERKFTAKRRLDINKQTQVNEKVHLCDICGKSSSTLNLLLAHKKNVHSEEKPYECQVCGNKYTAGYHLKRHMRRHTGEKPYPCSHCSKSFSDSSIRRRHERTHTGERPYECGSCKKSFTQHANLITHNKNVKCGR